jgi:hypothetical protein
MKPFNSIFSQIYIPAFQPLALNDPKWEFIAKHSQCSETISEVQKQIHKINFLFLGALSQIPIVSHREWLKNSG